MGGGRKSTSFNANVVAEGGWEGGELACLLYSSLVENLRQAPF